MILHPAAGRELSTISQTNYVRDSTDFDRVNTIYCNRRVSVYMNTIETNTNGIWNVQLLSPRFRNYS